ncbi:hypothetical protein ACWEP4_31185 [Streptomyces sp. NPDC004227]
MGGELDGALLQRLGAVEHPVDLADGEPTPVRAWLPDLARASGAKTPRRVPAWLVRLLTDESAVE